ncbi:hypothetical protein WDZ17_07635 [Pseudokineococcus basanitobsidens]|uniref:Uncharacterized protein n=1 Tax=Pseudokineococcus basanitobsidens TaxID=1926649 RepID=A0ABU8RJJ8_9ACTN
MSERESGSDGGRDGLERAADDLAATASQGQADVETPTGHAGRPAGSDVEGDEAAEQARRAAGGRDDVAADDVAPDDVAPDDVAPGPDAG